MSNSDNVVQQVQAAVALYEEKQIIPLLASDTQRFDVWKAGFQDYPTAWAEITLQAETIEARRAWELTQQGMSDGMLSVSAMLAHSHIQHYSQDNVLGGNYHSQEHKKTWANLFQDLQPKVALIWLDAFKYAPGNTFLNNLKEDAQKFSGVDAPTRKIIEEYNPEEISPYSCPA